MPLPRFLTIASLFVLSGAALIIACVFVGLQRRYWRPFLRHWTWSWLALAAYAALSGLARLVAVGHGTGAVRMARTIGRKQAHVRSPCVGAAALGVAGAHEEPIRPGIEACRIAQLREVTPDGQQRLLRGVLGEIEVAQNSMRHRVEPIARGHGKACEGLFVATLCSSHEIGVHALFRGGPVFARSTRSLDMGASAKGRTQSSSDAQVD